MIETAPPPISADELAGRRARAVRDAADRGLDGLLVFSRGGTSADFYGDVMYLSGFHSTFAVLPDAPTWSARGHAAMVLPVDGTPILLTDYLDEEDRRPGPLDVCVRKDLTSAIGEALREAGLAGRTVGLVGRETLTLAWYREIERAAGGPLDVVAADDLLDRHRMVKSEAELEHMRAAAAVGAGWMTTMLEALVEGRTEGDAVGEGLRYLAARGGMQYDIAIAGGPRSASYWGRPGIPHWDSTRRLEQGDLVHVDAWGPVDGYYTDLARSTVVGRRPDDGQREVLEGAIALVEHLIGLARPGVTCDELCRHGEAWLADHGFGEPPADDTDAQPSFGHALFGHSLGLTTERPWIVSGEATALEANMVIAIETVVGRPGVGSTNFEQTLVVGEDGPEILTAACPSRWWD